MADDQTLIVSHNRTLRLGYRLRWLYLALVVFGAIVWWGFYPGHLLWEQVGSWNTNPVLHAMDMVAFFWGLADADGWFSYDAGMAHVWGWPGTWWLYGSSSSLGRYWLWWAAGSFGMPLMFVVSVVCFVGIGPNSKKRLPAKGRSSWVALGMASAAGALVLGGGVMAVLHFIGGLGLWDLAWEYKVATGATQRFTPSLWTWPPQVACLLIAMWLPAALGFWLGVMRREVYWQLERMTRLIGLLSLGLLLFGLWNGLRPSGRWYGEYWAMGVEVWRTVWFSASTALLWAASCRVWLLFRLVKYEKQRVAMMTVSPVCFACEYDLSGSLRGGARRCPECGVAVPGEVVECFGAAAVPGSGVVETEEAGVGE